MLFRMLYQYYYTLVTVLFVALFAQTATALLAGKEQKCTNEGERVIGDSVKFIADVDPCMHCYCRKGLVKCQKTCPSLDDCPIIVYPRPKSQACCDVCVGCVEDGITYKNGDTWRDNGNACIVKECKAGVITRSELVCPAVQCSNPAHVEGQCCPSCPTCDIKPYQDQCVTCECKNGTSTCSKRACPVLNCHRSKMVHKDGECCPKCSGPRPLFLPPGKCLFQHKMYLNRRFSRINECTNCTCQLGTMSCQRDTCPVTQCAVEDQVYPNDSSCCPSCKPKALYKQCEYEGEVYDHGASWVSQCVDCVCNNSTITCTKKTCEVEQHCPLDTHQLKFTPGGCCSLCVERDGLCTVFGDPHYITFDKRIYDFQGTCKYLLAKDCESKKFAVYVQNFDRYNMPGAWTKSVTILIGENTRIRLRKNGKVHVNKSHVSLPFSKVGHFTVRYDKENIVVEAAIGLIVIWNTESYLELHVSASFKKNTCGMCGDFNGDPANDFVGKDRIVHSTAIEFAKSWQHGRQSACTVGVTQQEVQARCQDNFSKWRRAHQECTILKSRALRDCRKKINEEPYYRSCVTDSCNCPTNKQCTCDAVTAYVRECERAGFYNTKAPLDYSCSRQRRRIEQRVIRNQMLDQEYR